MFTHFDNLLVEERKLTSIKDDLNVVLQSDVFFLFWWEGDDSTKEIGNSCFCILLFIDRVIVEGYDN